MLVAVGLDGMKHFAMEFVLFWREASDEVFVGFIWIWALGAFGWMGFRRLV